MLYVSRTNRVLEDGCLVVAFGLEHLHVLACIDVTHLQLGCNMLQMREVG